MESIIVKPEKPAKKKIEKTGIRLIIGRDNID